MIEELEILQEGDRIVIKGRPASGRGEIAVILNDGSFKLRMDDGSIEHMPRALIMREPPESIVV